MLANEGQAKEEVRDARGPRGLPGLGSFLAYRRDRLNFLLRAREEYGDVFSFRLGRNLVYFVNHPDDVQWVLQKNAKNYVKATNLGAVFGQGIFTSDGELWKRQRRTMQPLFHAGHLLSLVPVAAQATEQAFAAWERRGLLEHRSVNLEREITALAFEVVGRALFGADLSAKFARLHPAMKTISDYLIARFYTLVKFPEWVPTPAKARFEAALAELDQIILEIVRETAGTPGRTLVSQLSAARDPESGEPMSERQLRDELVTLLLAGHETTAHAVSWALYLLAKNPDVAARARAEASAIGSLTGESLDRMPYLDQVVQETLRLYPAGWAWSRRALEDDVIRGFRIPAGSMILISPFITHRDPKLWENPEEFSPGRFVPERAAAISRWAYFPFGGGARQCIGKGFALIEMNVILSLILRDFEFELDPSRAVVPDAKTTIGTRGGVWMKLKRRARAS